MSAARQKAMQETPAEVVGNDFSIKVATVNGSGSQTSNSVLLRALFKMGIPVTGKNLFPSNIHGLPTWYIIRLSKAGYLAHRDTFEVVICMNGVTVAEDMASVAQGGVVLYDDSLPIPAHRKDVTYYPMPVNQLIKEANLPFKLRDYIANMVYVGVMAYLFGVEMAEIEAAVAWNFKGKRTPIELNMNMVRRAYAWAEANLTKADPDRAEHEHGAACLCLGRSQSHQGGPLSRPADERLQREQDPGRRQHSRRVGRHLRRCHLYRMVPHHAIFQHR